MSLPIWTVYEKPSDQPGHYVARLFVGEEAQDLALISTELERIQAQLHASGFVRMVRSPNDDPKIIEVWL